MKPLPERLVMRLIHIVNAYLATADVGPRGKKGVPALWTIDARARKLIAEIHAHIIQTRKD